MSNRRSSKWFLEILLLAGLGTFCAVGCQSLPRSGLDPYGERLFESNPLQKLNPANCDLLGRKKDAANAPQPVGSMPPNTPPATSPGGASVWTGSQPGTQPTYTGPPATPLTPSTGLLPGGIGSGQAATSYLPNYGSTATSQGSGVRGINTAIVAGPAFGPDSGAQTTPSPVFAETGGYALPTVPVEGPALIMTPREQIAPVGSEVVLISSFLGKGDHLITNEKIEWSLEGVGGIQKFDPGSHCDPLFFDYTRAKKVTDHYAVTKTSQKYQTLDRGTPETTDDLHLLRGQTWISVNSMREGTTHVTAFAPSLKDWSKRTDVGIIHWVDALWILPRLSIAPVGESRGLTTTVQRRTNGQARHDWIVRYEILNGPPAGFGPSQAQIVEERTDMSGQASVILYPKEQQNGTCTIGISIIRPAGVDGSDRRVTVGYETVRQTWAGSSNVFIRLQAPTEGKVGQDLPYKMTVSNKTSSYVRGVVALTIPPSAVCTASTPSAQQKDSTLLWDVDVPPQGDTEITFSLRFSSVGAPILTPQFYRQNSADFSPAISGISVPSAVPSTASQAPPPITTTPPAAVFQPTQQSAQPSTLPPATTFQPGNAGPSPTSQQLNIELLTPRAELNQPFTFRFNVKNTGSTTIQNARLAVEVPTEYRSTQLAGDTSAAVEAGQDSAGNVVLRSQPIPPGGTAWIELTYPSVPLSGHQLVGKFYVDGKLIDQKMTQITPVR